MSRKNRHLKSIQTNPGAFAAHGITLGRRVSAGTYFEPRTQGQANAFEVLVNRKFSQRLISGPAGTGKTFMASAAAAHFFEEGLVGQIVLLRPTVEITRSLGMLPGTLQDKLGPWARPLTQALSKLGIHYDPQVEPLKAKYRGQNWGEDDEKLNLNDLVHIESIGHQGGLTYDNAFIIVDEVQDCDADEVGYTLGTRVGEGSFITYLGSEDQCHLPRHRSSLLPRLERMFAWHHQWAGASYTMTDADIVRSTSAREFHEAWKATA